MNNAHNLEKAYLDLKKCLPTITDPETKRRAEYISYMLLEVRMSNNVKSNKPQQCN